MIAASCAKIPTPESRFEGTWDLANIGCDNFNGLDPEIAAGRAIGLLSVTGNSGTLVIAVAPSPSPSPSPEPDPYGYEVARAQKVDPKRPQTHGFASSITNCKLTYAFDFIEKEAASSVDITALYSGRFQFRFKAKPECAPADCNTQCTASKQDMNEEYFTVTFGPNNEDKTAAAGWIQLKPELSTNLFATDNCYPYPIPTPSDSAGKPIFGFTKRGPDTTVPAWVQTAVEELPIISASPTP